MTRFLSCLLVFFSFQMIAQQTAILWQKPVVTGNHRLLWFNNASAGAQHEVIPSYCGQVWSLTNAQLTIINAEAEPIPEDEVSLLEVSSLPKNFEIQQVYQQKNNVIAYCILPVRYNQQANRYERLVKFELQLNPKPQIAQHNKTLAMSDTSVLATGQWHKLAITTDGVYKITPQLLADCGFSTSNLASSSIRLFGNGNNMLSEVNANNPNPELQELSLYMVDGGDGVFSGNDYALFYAKGPHSWAYKENEKRFVHTYNIYAEQSYYFLTVTPGAIGKRMQQVGYAPANANYTVTSVDDFQFIETDQYNLVGSGREWFGDLFDFKLSYDYVVQFPNIISDTAWITARAVARSTSSGTNMTFQVNTNPVTTLQFPAVSTNSGAPYANADFNRVPFIPGASSLQIKVTYNNAINPSATAWLDYIEVEARRQLAISSNQIIFRDQKAYRAGGAAQYIVDNATASTRIWDVTNFNNQRVLPLQLSNNTASFIAPSDTLRTFVALSGSNFPLPAKVGAVQNQNLAGLTDIEMVIVSHPNFITEAQRLADYHAATQNLSVAVVTPEVIYNEFSSGMQDITAIKLFLRHLYKNPNATKPLRYLLLFGDASYDYKKRTPNDHNFVPIFQSTTSFSLYSSFCTDDFYGYLDDDEGRVMLLEDLDIGIGRMPVKTLSEAKASVDKVINYNTEKKTFDDWRNRALLISDDVDESWEMDFLNYMDRIGRELDTVYSKVNIEKIYIDSYVQEVKAGSQRYPGARDDLFRKVQRGNLVTSYLGHGGEVGWAKERILQLADINSWTNINQLPVFTTVTCEFTRVDDPGRVSAGEQLFLNPAGGAIGLYSTLRPVFANPSTYVINQQLAQYLFTVTNGQQLSLGEVAQAVKNSSTSSDKLRFTFIGDPAMYLALPDFEVITDEIYINDSLASPTDTLKALSKIKVKGHIENQQGALLADFNGILKPTVFDKDFQKVTLRNDGEGQPLTYKTRENVIYRGKAEVKNGVWEFEFVVPLDISFVVGNGKISYYATDSVIDAAGFNKDILVGSLDLSAEPDDEGPLVRLFINDTNFIAGGLTDKDPTGLALINDENGINTVGTGIGHDILGILDGNTGAPIILNDYFEADLNSYQSGTVAYPFFNLPAGEHHLLVRAWDVSNNMGQDEITFIVDESAQLALNRVLNYPNPFSKITRFQFEHNRAGEPLEVDIQIFGQNGDLVKRITEKLTSLGNRVNQITWDGTNEQGSQISSGVYVFRVIVRSLEDGSTATDYSKLVYIR